jgi:hypothetical protein
MVRSGTGRKYHAVIVHAEHNGVGCKAEPCRSSCQISKETYKNYEVRADGSTQKT